MSLNNSNYSESAVQIKVTVRKAIPGFPGYFVCQEGHVWSWLRGPFPKRLKGMVSSAGYVQHRIRGRNFQASRLVLLAHRGPPPSLGALADHINGDIRDNHPANLRYLTPKQSAAHKPSLGKFYFPETAQH